MSPFASVFYSLFDLAGPAGAPRVNSMPDIRLSDGSVRSDDAPSSGSLIGGCLVKDDLALRLDGALVDLATMVEYDAGLRAFQKSPSHGISPGP